MKVVWKMMILEEEENVVIHVLHEGDKTNEDSFNVSDLYYMNLSFIKYGQSS